MTAVEKLKSMNRLFQVYQLILVTGIVLSVGVIAFVWKRREETGSKPIIVVMIGGIIWMVAAFLTIYHHGTQAAIYYSKFRFPGVNLGVLGFFLLAVEYTGREEYITLKTLVVLSIEPILINVVIWANESLVLDVGGRSAMTMRGFVTYHEWAFYLHATYSYILLTAGTLMFVGLALRSNKMYRYQSAAIILGMSTSWIGNILYVTEFVPVDTAPLGFTVSGLLVGWAILSARLLDYSPIARDSLVETIQDGVFVLDQNARIVDINEKGREILGCHATPGEIGDPIQQFAGESVPISKLLGLHRETTGDVIEISIDGRYYTAQARPLHGIRDEFVGSVFLVHDITEQKNRQDELANKNQQLDQFASVVSHDLRNPLNIATGYSDLAQETDDDEHFDRVETAHDRMENLIEDLLTLARKNDHITEREWVSLSTIARNAWNNVQTDAGALDVGDTTLLADPDRLQQLFENLFRNAAEHGGQDISVTVGSFDGDGFFVEDDGPGIDPDMRERILETGVTTAEDGTGLGLAIVQNVVEAHGWELNVTESTEGGARFEIRDITVGE